MGKNTISKEDKYLWKYFTRDLHWGRSALSRNIFDFLIAAKYSVNDNDIVLDAGAGQCRYKPFFDKRHYIATDFAQGDIKWDYGKLDIVNDIVKLPIISESIDLVLSTSTLEHVNEPQLAINESYRVLRNGGHLFLYVPHCYPEHQIPHDYFRYTRYGLKFMLEKAGFSVESITPSNGALLTGITWATRSLEYLPNYFPMILIKIILGLLFLLILKPFFTFLDRFDKKREFPICYLIVGKKIKGGSKNINKNTSKNEIIKQVLACPECKSKISINSGSITCEHCNKTYEVIDGTPHYI